MTTQEPLARSASKPSPSSPPTPSTEETQLVERLTNSIEAIVTACENEGEDGFARDVSRLLYEAVTTLSTLRTSLTEAEERLSEIQDAVDNGEAPSWLHTGMSWCPSCDADPKVGHFADCIIGRAALGDVRGDDESLHRAAPDEVSQ